MRLTTFSDYSMRVMIYLSLQRDSLATIADIAKAYSISENHLTKVVHHLAKQGYIDTIRGKGGGMRLAKDPQQVNLGAVLRDTEGGSSLLACVDGEGDCCIMPACKLIRILRESQEALYAVLDKYTLADLLIDQAPLKRILLAE